ncbi:50S ribosomal protein L15 [Candidatus Nasuia deltocephalinicola]|uniref:50S ribosomal protein L15 n=1 Tax=Candidatus Nasuia deltocephalincola TaxID=1160784 RepID=UPI00216ABED5|nr:50S ribosomal protein L15 [Candidatus Nasuia deltocephalinicola]
MFIKNIYRKNIKRLGKGENSHHGKTCGKGHKGQKSRSGSKISLDFEGGQTKLFKRLPKFGFKKKKKNYSLNLLKLNCIPFSIISIYSLKKINFVSKNIFLIKIFSNFLLKKKIFYNVFLSKYLLFLFSSMDFIFIFY